MINLYHIPGKYNQANIMNKNLSLRNNYPIMKDFMV